MFISTYYFALYSTKFLISRLRKSDDTSFYPVLVDHVTKIKIDIFDYSNHPHKPTSVLYQDKEIFIMSKEDQLVKTSK